MEGEFGSAPVYDDFLVEPSVTEAAPVMLESRLERARKELEALEPRSLSADEEIAISRREDLSPRHKSALEISQRFGLGETVDRFEENIREATNFTWQNGLHVSATVAMFGVLPFNGWWTLPSGIGEVLAGYLILKMVSLAFGRRERPPSRLARKLGDQLINKPLRPLLVDWLAYRRLNKIDKQRLAYQTLLHRHERQQALEQYIRDQHGEGPKPA